MNLEVSLSYISLTLNTSCSIMKILTYRISTDNWEQILSAFRKKRPHSVSINNFYRINSFVRQSRLYLSWYGFQKISRCGTLSNLFVSLKPNLCLVVKQKMHTSIRRILLVASIFNK